MNTFRWLHLTDLHLGMPGQQSLWPNVEEMFLKDLDYLRTHVGPWDLVLFTGDITQRGTEPEFDGSRSPSEARINELGEGLSSYMTILSGG